MGLLNLIFGSSSEKLVDFKDRGALVMDVRTPSEFKNGHVQGSRNIPLQEIQKRKNEILNWGKPVIVCCASGARSGQANSVLQGAGVECINGGSWTKVNAVFG